jgi:very-short-patch-repair endonuclease
LQDSVKSDLRFFWPVRYLSPLANGIEFVCLLPMNNENQIYKSFARELRKSGTKGEAMLWKHVLKARKMDGYQFNRQFVIGNYIVDFICRKLKLIIEIDGSSHWHRNAEDRTRQDEIERAGYKVIRFKEQEVVYNIDEIQKQIYHVVRSLKE